MNLIDINSDHCVPHSNKDNLFCLGFNSGKNMLSGIYFFICKQSFLVLHGLIKSILHLISFMSGHQKKITENQKHIIFFTEIKIIISLSDTALLEKTNVRGVQLY